MDFRVTDTAQLSPTCCFLCTSERGPFVFVHGMRRERIASADGPKNIEGSVYLCIGTRENPGCASQIATVMGGMDRWRAEEIMQRAATQREAFDAEVEELRVQLGARVESAGRELAASVRGG